MKIETDDMHAIFLLKKNVKIDIIKIILEYSFIAVPESLKEWKVAIILVKQGYKSTKERQDYRIGLGITYGGKRALINIEKTKYNYNKDRKLKCFNYNIYRHIVKDCRKPKKEKETRKCYKYNKVKHFAKNYKSKQMIKNKSIQNESDNKDKSQAMIILY